MTGVRWRVNNKLRSAKDDDVDKLETRRKEEIIHCGKLFYIVYNRTIYFFLLIVGVVRKGFAHRLG